VNSSIIEVKENNEIFNSTGFRFVGFSSKIEDNMYGLHSPFELAKLYDDQKRKLYYVPFESLVFDLFRFDRGGLRGTKKASDLFVSK
jgi:hypothetical protein